MVSFFLNIKEVKNDYKKIDDAESNKEETKQVEKKHVVRVVAQLPMQPVRIAEDEQAIYHYVTIEEYLTSQANRVKE